MLEVKGQRIVLDGVDIGIYAHCKTPSAPSGKVIEMFNPKSRRILKRLLKGERVIDYVWISDIGVKPNWRRQGIASRLIEKVCAKPATLVACAPGSGVRGGMRMSHTERLEFYRSLNFTIVEGARHDYAFRFTPSNG